MININTLNMLCGYYSQPFGPNSKLQLWNMISPSFGPSYGVAPKSRKYTVYQENPYFVKNMHILKNPQFSSIHYKILSKWGTHEDLILTKFRNDWVKIVDFFIKAYFWQSIDSPDTQCRKKFRTILWNHFLKVTKSRNSMAISHPIFGIMSYFPY